MTGVGLLLLALAASASATYTDQFAVHVEGGLEAARELARKHGLVFLGKIFDDVYHFRHRKLTKRSIDPDQNIHEALRAEPKVKWFEQQKLKRRPKRDFIAAPASSQAKRPGRDFDGCFFNDPRWPQMWYLNRGHGIDMNVEPVWAQGITGKGVVVTILDDGLEKDHPDIYANYDPEASYDVNGHDSDPQPRYDLIDSNRHGTRCAGEVSASANNSICGVGVSFEASIGGVRMLDGDVTDAVEARSLSLNPNHVDIYSASWGPDDDGKTVDGPGILATRAFMEGVEKGRGGLGSIYVWASGNGGREHDNCNCDGYTNSIWTLSISSATEFGSIPWYSEACSSTVASTYSSGSAQERQITTTDLHHGCTSGHTGTSASAPLAAGLCALTLEANKKLTWRDLQHIVVRTSRSNNLRSKDWRVNGAGRNVSHVFGFGLLDAAAMVELAKVWQPAPPQKVCEIRAYHVDKIVPAKSRVDLSLDVNCENVQYLEHVQSKISITATRRGDLHIYLTSPMGTRSTLLAQRPLDSSRSGFQGWPFMTVHNWGENPNGLWKLEIHNEGRFYGRAALKEWALILYGTTESPDSAQQTVRRESGPPPTRTLPTPAPLPAPTPSVPPPRRTTFIPPVTHQYYPVTTAKPSSGLKGFSKIPTRKHDTKNTDSSYGGSVFIPHTSQSGLASRPCLLPVLLLFLHFLPFT